MYRLLMGSLQVRNQLELQTSLVSFFIMLASIQYNSLWTGTNKENARRDRPMSTTKVKRIDTDQTNPVSSSYVSLI